MRQKLIWLAAASAAALSTAAVAQTQPAPTPPPNETPTTVEQVVVTAAPFAVAEDELITNVDVVTRDELDVAPASGLGDVLNGLPGVRTTFFGQGASRPVIRGLAGPRVQVLTNGVGLIDASALSPDHQVAADPGEATRIEVLRGPSALRYGGSAIGGVVNVLDERVPERQTEDGLDGRVSAQASSVDDGLGASGRVFLGQGPWVASFDATYRKTDDYAVPVPPESRRQAELEGEEPEPADEVENSAVELTAYGAGVSYLPSGGGFIGVSVKRTETTYGVPGHAHHHEEGEEGEEGEGEEHEEAAVTIDLEQTRFDFRGELPVAFGPFAKLQWSSGIADYEHVELEGSEVGTRFLSDGWEGRVELVQAERTGWEGAVGVQALSRSLEAEGEEAYVPATDISEAGVFTVQRVDRDTHGFEGGLRLDRRDLDSVAGQRDFTNISASAGAFVRPSPGLFLGVSLSRTGRAPTEAELFAFGAHAATRGFEIGDAGLDSEVVYSLEGSAHYDQGPLDLDVHVFTARYDGFIDLRATGEEDEESEFPIFVYRQTDATFVGTEVEAAYEFWRDGDRRMAVEGAFDWVRGETDLGNPARIPPPSLTGRLVYGDETFGGRLEVRRVAEQDRIAEFELPTDAYTMVNLFVSARPFQDRRLTLFAEGRNLTDEEAREHASFLKDLAPLPGRNFRAGLALRF